MEKGEPGEGRGNLSEEGFPLPSPGPPSLLFPRLLTGGEAARREFRWMRRQLDEEAEFRHFFRTGLKPGQKERRDVL